MCGSILCRLFQDLDMRSKKACAHIRGSEAYPDIEGIMEFYDMYQGTLVALQIFGLPWEEGQCKERIFALHIHEGNQCTGNSTDPFADAKLHFNPGNCQHPEHAGDLPPIFGNHGFGYMIFYTERFTPQEILNRTVIVHSHLDDFTTQPSGDAMEKIACGMIQSAE